MNILISKNKPLFNVTDRVYLAQATRQLAMDLAAQWPLQFGSSLRQLQWCCVQLGLQLVMDIPSHTLFFEEINAR